MATPPEHSVQLPGFKRSSQARDSVQPRETGVRLPAVKPKSSAHASVQTSAPLATTAASLTKTRTPSATSRQEHAAPDASTSAPTRSKPPLPSASAAAVSDLQGRRQEKQWQIQLRQLRSMAQLIGFGLLLVLSWQWLQSLNLFAAPKIQVVSPIQLTPPAAINNVLATLVPTQQPSLAWLTLNQGRVAKTIESQLPFVQRAVVQPRLFPSRLDVALQETAPWAVVYTLRPKTPLAVKPKATPSGDQQVQGKLPLAADSKTEGMNQDESAVLGKDKTKAVPMVWVVSGYLVAGETQFRPFSALSTGARNQLLGFLAHPSQPYIKVLAPNAAAAKGIRWVAIRELSQWLNELPEWQTAWLDCSQPDAVVIRHKNGPDVLLGALNHDWQQRFQRLGLLMPYWKGWQHSIEAIDLRWPSQISLVPVKGKTLPSDWETRLATPTDANAL